MSRAKLTVKRLRQLLWLSLPALVSAGEPSTVPVDEGAPVQHLAPAPKPQLQELEPGLWEYTRSQLRTGESKPHTQTLRRCSDPHSEIKTKIAELGARGCTFRPIKQQGSRYEMIWSCKIEADQTVSMRDVITVTGPGGYHDESDAIVPQGATHTSLSAIRVGDCTPAERSAQAARARPSIPSPASPHPAADQ